MATTPLAAQTTSPALQQQLSAALADMISNQDSGQRNDTIHFLAEQMEFQVALSDASALSSAVDIKTVGPLPHAFLVSSERGRTQALLAVAVLPSSDCPQRNAEPRAFAEQAGPTRLSRQGDNWACAELSLQDALSDPLIALLRKADHVDDRSYAQLLFSAARVLFGRAGSGRANSARNA